VETEYEPGFTLEFDLDPARPIRYLRWDPLETRFCRVRLREVRWEDADGLVARLDLARVASNGRRQVDGDGGLVLDFETIDPMVFLPISGPVARVTIVGECEAADVIGTLVGFERAVQSRTRDLARLDDVLLSSRQGIAEQEQTFEAHRDRLEAEFRELQRQNAALRGQVSLQFDELVGARRQLEDWEREIVGLNDWIRERDRKIEHGDRRIREGDDRIREGDDRIREGDDRIREGERRIRELEDALGHREALLRSIFESRRWRAIDAARAALHFLPRRLARLQRRLAARRPAPTSAAGEPPGPHRVRERSGRETPV
jgi:chromosome segregation ATPase